MKISSVAEMSAERSEVYKKKQQVTDQLLVNHHYFSDHWHTKPQVKMVKYVQLFSVTEDIINCPEVQTVSNRLNSSSDTDHAVLGTEATWRRWMPGGGLVACQLHAQPQASFAYMTCSTEKSING